MKRTITALALGLTLTACGGSPAERRGDPEVYARIESMDDCKQLQRQFDVFVKHHDHDLEHGRLDEAQDDTAYMDAADARMKAVGC
jgi:hypothetical protein